MGLALDSNSTSANDGIDYEPSDGAIIFTTLYIIGGMIVMGTSLGLILQSLLEGPSTQAGSRPLTLTLTLTLALTQTLTLTLILTLTLALTLALTLTPTLTLTLTL